MPHESDVPKPQAGLLPEQSHQSVGVGTGGGVALAVGDEQKSSLHGRGPPILQRLEDLTGETVDEQGVRGIDRIMVDRESWVPAACGPHFLAKHRPLPDVQVNGRRQHEEERGLVADGSVDNPAQLVLTRVIRRSCRQAGEIDPGGHAEGTFGETSRSCLSAWAFVNSQAVSRGERSVARRITGLAMSHPGQIFSRPPMRPFLAMVPITSIMSRTPIREVTSEMS